jgi:uncharacterized protein
MDDAAGERARFPGLGGAVALVGLLLMAQLMISLAVRRSTLDASEAVLGTLVAIVVGNLFVLGLYFARRRIRWADVLHPGRASVGATVGVLLGPLLLVTPAVFMLAIGLDDVVESFIPMSDAQRSLFEEMFRGGYASFLLLVIAAPVFEELVFRGVVLRGLLARTPPGVAIALSAVVFGAAHLNWQQFATATLLGLPLGWLYWRFRSTWPGILLHAMHNGLTLLAVTLADGDLSGPDLPLLAWAAALAVGWAGAVLLLRLAGHLRQSGA